MQIEGHLIDVAREEIYPALVRVEGSKISDVARVNKSSARYILPGLIDAHIHIESSMLSPSRFAEVVVPHGTTSVISDPHEIANVLGIDGVRYMLADATTPLRVYYTAPSCVPATSFETSGASLDAQALERLMELKNIIALGEMMNFPGVVNEAPAVLAKLALAKRCDMSIDGHAPGLSGSALLKYVGFGITTDHECTSLDEAREKMQAGMQIMIREGSSAKNLKALLGLNYDNCMLVSDDRCVKDLMQGHLDVLVREAVSLGIDPMKTLKMLTINPARHYGLNSGALEPGRNADIIVVDDLRAFDVVEVYIGGKLVAEAGKPLFEVRPKRLETHIVLPKPITPGELAIRYDANADTGKVKVNVIETLPHQIVTKRSEAFLDVKNHEVMPDAAQDVLKLVVADRYGKGNIGKGFVKGFGLRRGALASSVAHDSHNLIAVGVDDGSIARALNVVAERGGFVLMDGDNCTCVELPVAGLMSDEPARVLESKMNGLVMHLEALGCTGDKLGTLTFLALLVIPELKLSDKGLFDSTRFEFVDVVVGKG